MKVYLQYPWKFPDSPYYKYLIDSPAKGIEYLNAEKQKGVITSKRFFWFSNFLKRNIRRWANKLNLKTPNIHLSPKRNYDLIHCAHCLSKNKDKPWIADIEMLSSFAISGLNTKIGKEKIRKVLMRKNCKKILPWASSVEKEILKVYPELKNKIEVVYPAVPERKGINRKGNKRLSIIFIARYFDIKGGLIALEVLSKLIEKYHIKGIIVSDVSKELKEKYPNIEYYNLIPQKELFNLMNKSDIFLYPSSVDTFGFSLLEAMSFGLPTITINTIHTKSRREIIENGKNGFIFDVENILSYDKIGTNENIVIDKLVNNTSKLIEDNLLRERMSDECLRIIKEGKFSIKERNKKLKRIYLDVIQK